jgi:hypothetical protein
VAGLVLVFAGAFVVVEVSLSAVTLLLVVAQPLRKNPRSNDNRIEGLTVRVMFELIKSYGYGDQTATLYGLFSGRIDFFSNFPLKLRSAWAWPS